MARDKAREEYLEVREGRRDEITLARDKKATETRMRKLKEKIDKGEFTKPAKRERKVDDELMRLRHEEQQIKERFLEGVLAANLARRTRFARIIDGFKEFAHFTRAFFTAFDLSATLRQGGFISLGHPVMASKLVKTMLKSAWSEAYQLSRQHELLQRENSKNGLYTAAGLELLKATGVTLAQMEEAYMGRWIQKIPQMAGGGFLRGSARAYTTFLNELRAEAFDALAFSLTPTGKPTLEEAKAIATYVNLATGRGKLSGRWQQSAVTLNTIFFAPKYVASRWQLMLGLPFWRGNARTRRLIAGEYARWAIGLGVIYGLYALFHAGDDDDEVDFDWRSSSFGKLKFGDTFLDPLSGIAQNTALVGRLVSNETKTASGVTKSLEPGGPPGQRNRVDVIWGYIRSKFSPLVGATFSGLAHEDMQGERTNLVREYGRIMVPLTFQDVAETLEEQGLPKGMAISLASILGWGVTTYDNENREELDRDDANWLYDKELAVPRLSKDSTADDVTPGSVFGLTHKIAKARGMDSPLTEEQKETLLKRSLPKVTEAIEKAREDFKDMPDDEAGRAAEMAKIQHELDRRVSHARRDALLKMLRE